MKKIVCLLSTLCAVVVLFFAVQQLLMPKYMTSVYEGALIGEYYKEEKNHQVVFIGDCEVYDNFSPVALWQECGISSYIRGGPEQLVWQSYYILEDTLRYETPDVVVFSVLAMQQATAENEAYNRLNLDGLRFSSTKINAIKASMLPEENMLSYIFPVFRFHERWQELESADFKYFFKRDSVGHNGYIMHSNVKPVGKIPEGRPLKDYSFDPLCYEYLDKITALCKEKGVQLVLVKAPSIYPYWYSEWDEQIVNYAQENNLDYYNLLDAAQQAGIDYETDTYDAGLHLNVYGAEKLSAYFGNILQQRYNLQDMRSDEKLSAIWQQKTENYLQMQQNQLDEIEKQGKIITYIY